VSDLLLLGQAVFEPDKGDTAWMLAATALVLLMTPALGLFYAGLVRMKNALNTFMMCIAAIAVALICWAVVGYSIAFDDLNGMFGGLDYAFLGGVNFNPIDNPEFVELEAAQSIPGLLFFAFQATFCIITTALISGAVVERMRFGPFLLFAGLWSILVYSVLAHWGFGLGWLADRGTLDFAGGVPVEMGSGFSALAAALVVGARKDFGRQALLPHNSVYILIGAGLLWFGWFGFNGGSGFGVNENGVLAFVNTLLTPACTLAMWALLDYIRGRQITAVGAATAIIVGCVAITPAGGFISPGWAMALGALAALPCYGVIIWRTRAGVDETLDVLAAHGVAGFTGILFIGFVAQLTWNADLGEGLLYGSADLLADQAIAAVATPAYAFGATYILLRLIGLAFPLRGSERDEALGMDGIYHGEEAYPSGEGAILVTPIDADGNEPSPPPRVSDPA
jgi:ammonium transporter, Amt family